MGYVVFEKANGVVQSLNGRQWNCIRLCGGPAWKVRRFQDSGAIGMIKYASFRSNFTMTHP